jgi:hypothetical protein
VKKSAPVPESFIPQPVVEKKSAFEPSGKACRIEDFRMVSVLGRGHFGKVIYRISFI